mgnify:CR=1 FL=1
MTTTTLLAVNGTLMRGLELNKNMLKAGGVFVREDLTDAHYRLWSINDRHPGMIRVAQGGTQVALEIWALPLASFAELLMSEPAGLAIGKVKLADGSEVLGVLDAFAALLDGGVEAFFLAGGQMLQRGHVAALHGGLRRAQVGIGKCTDHGHKLLHRLRQLGGQGFPTLGLMLGESLIPLPVSSFLGEPQAFASHLAALMAA